MTDVGRGRDLDPAERIAFVRRRLWRPRLCNVCWRFIWLGVHFVRLHPEFHADKVMCRSCGMGRLTLQCEHCWQTLHRAQPESTPKIAAMTERGDGPDYPDQTDRERIEAAGGLIDSITWASLCDALDLPPDADAAPFVERVRKLIAEREHDMRDARVNDLEHALAKQRDEGDDLRQQLAERERELAACVEAVRKYGVHLVSCRAHYREIGMPSLATDCDCGMNTMLADLSAFAAERDARLIAEATENLRKQNARWFLQELWWALTETALLIDAAISESNGIYDNEWRTQDGAVVPEWPIGSFVTAMDRLGKILPALKSFMGHPEWSNAQQLTAERDARLIQPWREACEINMRALRTIKALPDTLASESRSFADAAITHPAVRAVLPELEKPDGK